MLRAILVFALVLGIVIGGLLLLRRTANMQPPDPEAGSPACRQDNSEEDEEQRAGKALLSASTAPCARTRPQSAQDRH